MNIYLDIDGTIKNTAASINDVIELLEYCLNHFEGNVYWLTTHCRNDANRTYEVLDFLPEELRLRAYKEIKPTDWNVLKTDAIDFNQSFVWLDDTVMQAEMKVLVDNNAMDGLYKINPKNSNCTKEALAFIKSK